MENEIEGIRKRAAKPAAGPPREYLFDNYKALLILLVVVGHFIEPCYEKNAFLSQLKWAIVMVHMPAFIFISGYFSKKAPNLKKLISGLAVPYLVYEALYYLLYTFVLDKETGLYLARPKFSLWYLMALFVWRLAAPYVRRIPHYMLLTLAGGLVIGLYDIGNFLSIPRILYFFPFFLAGQDFDSRILSRWRCKKGYAAAVCALTGLVLYLALDTSHNRFSQKMFYGRYGYDWLGFDPAEGIAMRAVCYLVSFTLVFLLLLVLPAERRPYSYLGERTMAIYIGHGFIYNYLKDATPLLASVNSAADCLCILTFCVFLVWFLGRKPFVRATDRIAHLL